MADNPVRVLTKYTELVGDTFRFYFGGVKEAIVTTNPTVIQHVLKTNADNYHKSEIQVKRMGHFLGKGLLTSDGETWRTQRRSSRKVLIRKQLDVLASIMQDSLAESLRDFDLEARTGPVIYTPILMRMTFGMVAQVSVRRPVEGRRHQSHQPDHLNHPGIYGSSNHSALPESLV